MTATPDSGTEASDTPEAIRHQVRVEFRIYLVVVAFASLVVGGLIGNYLYRNDQRGMDSGMEIGQPAAVVMQTATVGPTANDQNGTLSVYVSGAVSSAQIVTLAQGSLVVDAIAAAGGASLDADLDAINLAAPLRDHEHVLVPRHGEPGAPQSITILVNINTATSTELEALPHIGPTRAQQIVSYREDNGPYQNKEAIMQVPGIGTVIFEEISPFITVDVK